LKLLPVREGEWAGWGRYDTDPFEAMTGPFYARRDERGAVVCAFRAGPKHMNESGATHGGCLVTFADYSLFMIAEDALAGSGSVTASLNAEFVDAGRLGELIESRGEVVRAGASLVFVRGLVCAGARPLLNFSAIVKKIRPRTHSA
jgi:acyl-coenzyme A thioesterase PaaI-like protein